MAVFVGGNNITRGQFKKTKQKEKQENGFELHGIIQV
jgi:hypothetical protein